MRSAPGLAHWRRSRSPSPGAGDPPAFLAHGDADTTVRLKNSRNLAAKLEAAGVPVELKVYPGVNHIPILLALTRTFRGKAQRARRTRSPS